jgi:TfoX/Sxy family transcriptional regulator of competence genes
MAYDEGLAARIRERFDGAQDVVEKQMFGGVAFMVNTHMCVGVVGSEMMIRLGKDTHDEVLAEPHMREMDFTGRVMRGWAFVTEDGVADDAVLQRWVDRCAEHAREQPRK